MTTLVGSAIFDLLHKNHKLRVSNKLQFSQGKVLVIGSHNLHGLQNLHTVKHELQSLEVYNMMPSIVLEWKHFGIQSIKPCEIHNILMNYNIEWIQLYSLNEFGTHVLRIYKEPMSHTYEGFDFACIIKIRAKTEFDYSA